MRDEAAVPTAVATGRLEGIFVAPTATAPMQAVQRVRAVVGRGLEGDRYFSEQGTYSPNEGPGRRLTLVEAEALDAVASETGTLLGPGESRRNLVTRGVRLNELVGKRLWIVEVECLGVRLCPPCGHLERVTGRSGLQTALHERGGLRVDILNDGEIAVGDPIRVV